MVSFIPSGLMSSIGSKIANVVDRVPTTCVYIHGINDKYSKIEKKKRQTVLA